MDAAIGNEPNQSVFESKARATEGIADSAQPLPENQPYQINATATRWDLAPVAVSDVPPAFELGKKKVAILHADKTAHSGGAQWHSSLLQARPWLSKSAIPCAEQSSSVDRGAPTLESKTPAQPPLRLPLSLALPFSMSWADAMDSPRGCALQREKLLVALVVLRDVGVVAVAVVVVVADVVAGRCYWYQCKWARPQQPQMQSQ